ncbi:protein fem-1 homolog C-like [Ylistrum balloti]|uniref:protein fem-1 homolog C-like n=1 Tax=Ylistrum balloti TaxID=509963 RepID=UPI0029057ECD|nr:protein fem-1 homolog C-like [Ylistrum balloti]
MDQANSSEDQSSDLDPGTGAAAVSSETQMTTHVSGGVMDDTCNGQPDAQVPDEMDQSHTVVRTSCNQARLTGNEVDTTAPDTSQGNDGASSVQPNTGSVLVNGSSILENEPENGENIFDSEFDVIDNIAREGGPLEERVSYIPNDASRQVDGIVYVGSIRETVAMRNLSSIDPAVNSAEETNQQDQSSTQNISENKIDRTEEVSGIVDSTEMVTLGVCGVRRTPEEVKYTAEPSADLFRIEPTLEGHDTTERALEEHGTTELASEELGTTERTSEELGTTERTSKELGTTERTTEELGTTERTTEELDTTELASEELDTTEQRTGDVSNTHETSGEVSSSEKTSSEVGSSDKTSTETECEGIVNFRKVVQEFLDGIKDHMPVEEPDTTESLAAFVRENIVSKNIRTIKYALRDLSKPDRKEVVDYEIDGNSALFIACEKGTEEMVTYFAVECDADTNKKGKYDCGEKEMVVAPLWLATIEEKPEIVKILACNGADVNAVCSTGSTAVHAACYMNNTELVEALCNSGSDVNIPDTFGSTCLKDSVDNIEICKILIDHGADVNYRRENQYSILHHAIKAHSLETVELLVRNGAGIMIKDFEGNDCLRYAVLVYAPDIMEFLLDSINANAPKSADVYDLMGAMAVGRGEYKEGYEYWLRSMYIRTELRGGATSLREVPEIFGKDVEVPHSISDMVSLAKNCDAMDALALAITSHQLGPTHWDTIQRVLLQSTSLLHNDDLIQAFDMTRYVYSLLLNKYKVLHKMQEFALSQLFEICSKFQIQTLRGTSIPRFKEILDIFRDMIDFLEKAHLLKDTDTEYFIQNSSIFDKVIDHVFDMIYLLKVNNKSSDEKFYFKSQMERLIQMNLCDLHGSSLLHKSLTRKPKIVYHFMETNPREARHEDLCVTRELIHAGANVNVQDLKRDTPLHSHLKWIEQYNFFSKKIIELFLDYGLHVDLIDIDNISLLVMIKARGLTICPVKYHTLQCLAVKVIRDHGIHFRTLLPIPLQRFVDMHK